jgi:hypothetical protein
MSHHPILGEVLKPWPATDQCPVRRTLLILDRQIMKDWETLKIIENLETDHAWR